MRHKARRLALDVLVAIAAVAFVSVGAPAHAQARGTEAVALVTELSGTAETQMEGKTVAVSLLFEFHPGATVKLYQGAKMIVLFYRTARQSAITGPSLIRASDTAIKALSGNEPISMQALAGKNGKALVIHPAGVTQGALVVRGLNKPIPTLSLAGGTTLELRPTFRWREVVPGLDYQFTLKDENEKVLHRLTWRGTTLQLPPELVLSGGRRYRWSVFAQAADGTTFRSNYGFTVADAAMRAEVENFRPDQTASPSERVAFAVWLEQAGLNDEAVRYWQQLAAEGIPLPPKQSAAAK
jgi:hypothetical protein